MIADTGSTRNHFFSQVDCFTIQGQWDVFLAVKGVLRSVTSARPIMSDFLGTFHTVKFFLNPEGFMKKLRFFSIIAAAIFLTSCGMMGSKPEPIRQETFLTLADVTGRTTLQEDSPDVRVINVKAKAFIKQNDIRQAKQAAVESASQMAVDSMIRELMTAEDYNRHYEDIDRYFSQNINHYIAEYQVNGERRIYGDKFYGIAAAFKVSRQKTLVALQKDLRIIDASGSSLVTVITSPKDLNLEGIGFRFSDIEDALMNQIQTDLNQRGLTAMDYRIAIASIQSDPKLKGAIGQISKDQFMAMISGSKAEQTLLSQQLQDAEAFYSSGLSILQAMAKVVVEVNIMSVSKTANSMVMNLNVTAKNISVGTGGAFANTIVQVARRGGPQTDDSAMLTGLIRDAYGDMSKEFIPQVIRQMSTIDVGGDKLIRYELVLKGFDQQEFGRIARSIQRAEDDTLRYIDRDNSLRDAQPSLNRIFVRYAGRASRLGDKVMEIFDTGAIAAKEPIVAPDLTDLVFEKLPPKR
jgi:hypothetical protein